MNSPDNLNVGFIQLPAAQLAGAVEYNCFSAEG